MDRKIDIGNQVITIIATHVNGRIDLKVGDIPALIWDPGPSIFWKKPMVLLSTVDYENGYWGFLTEVVCDGNRYPGFTDDQRLVAIGRLSAIGRAMDVPLGEIHDLKQLESE
ncbi:MAG: hypothetical protein LBI69_03720 [Puniceicoccales bacterium]|nr:hypothetical protein [Puniceicoccales bacterium]